MSGKYSEDSELTDFLPVQTNASSMSLPANTSDICCHPKASPWPRTRSRSSKIGPNPGKSRTFNPSSVSPTSIVVSFTVTPKSRFRSRVLPARVPLGTSPMSAVPPLKHLKRLSPQLRSLPIGFRTLQLQSRLTLPTTHSPLSFRLQLRMASCTRLHSTPGLFPLRNSTTMSTTKSSSLFLKLSSDGDITSKALDFRSMWSLITGTCNIFPRPKSSRVDKHDGPNTFPGSTSSSVSVPENLEPNPTHLLDDGTSILKRGIATMPVSTRRISARYSLPSNWHRPSELPPYPSQSFVDLSSWMLKGSIPTSGLNSEMIPFPPNTSTLSQTPHGPSTLMVYSVILDVSMFQIPGISDSVFSSTRTTIPLQDISVRQRLFTKSECTTTGPDSRSTSRTTASRAPYVPAPNQCATNPTDSSSNFLFPRNPGTQFPWIS